MGRTSKRSRLFLKENFEAGQLLCLSKEQSHYLKHVMRLDWDDSMLVFNGKQGEWSATLVDHMSLANQDTKDFLLKEKTCLKRKTDHIHLRLGQCLRPQGEEQSLFLFFPPLKASPLSYLLEKGTELGVTNFCPVWTERSQRWRICEERHDALTREAAEQCGRLDVPVLEDLETLNEALRRWHEANWPIWVCDERRESPSLLNELSQKEKPFHHPLAFLIGPEGGFSSAEFKKMARYPQVSFVSLAPHILRAETAAVVALGTLASFMLRSQSR